MEQGIVLLPASQIFTDDSSEAASPEVKGHLSNGRPVYSTGKLERALAVGHRVLVPNPIRTSSSRSVVGQIGWAGKCLSCRFAR